jgi:GT2 family glycosyltransferase
MRRLMKSYVRPGHFPRDLIVAELKGSFVGLTRYQRARRNAKLLAAAVAQYGPVAKLPNAGTRARPPRKRTELKIAVRSIDIAQPIQDIDDIAGYDAVRVIVTRGLRPIGDMLVPSFGKPVSQLRVREALAKHVTAALFAGNHSVNAWDRWMEARQHVASDLLATDHTSDERVSLPSRVGVSVVVATCDRPDDLRACLASLTSQQTRRPVEIIVVDNRPGSGLTAPVVAEFSGVRVVEEHRPGLSYARNAGISASTGEIIIATDDDVTMPAEWLETLVAPFARADVMVVTGNTLPLELDTHAQQLFEQYGGLGRGYVAIEADRNWFTSFRKRAAPTWVLGATANAAFRASIFADPRIGMVDETLGAGSPTGCSEDTYVFYKVLRAGYTIVYEPNAYVWHRHRRDIEALKSQIYNYSKGHVAYHLTTALNDGDLRGLHDIFVRLPHWRYKQVKSYVKRSLTGRDRYPLSLVAAETAGNVAAPYALWKSRRRVKQLGRSVQYVPPQLRSSEHEDAVIDRDPVAAS